MKNRLLIYIFFLTMWQGNAQPAKKPIIVETRVHAGMTLPFYKALNYLIQDDIYAFDLSLSFPTFGKDFWEKLYNFPRTGVGCSYWTLGNDVVYGRAYVLYTFINIPVYKASEKLSFNTQFSFGTAYLPKTFDINKNHLNRAIGANANIYIRLGIDGRVKIFPRSELIIEAGATHFSNGKTRSPNYGLNAGSFSLGFNYLLNNTSNIINEPEIPVITKKHVQSVILSAGSKVYDNLSGKRYFISSAVYNFERRLTHISKVGLGGDLFYDGAISEALASDEGIPEKDFANLIRFGLHTSYAAQYKRMTLGLQLGYYVYSKYTDLSSVYNRISIQYKVTDNFFGSFSVKSHMGKADFIEWGIGYCW